MPGKTAISWCDVSWNAVVGCDHVSAGCDHCYAAAFHNRMYLKRKRDPLKGLHIPPQYALPFWGRSEGHVQLMPARVELPLHWRKPRRVFVNSVSDLFHPQVPYEFIHEVWRVMRQAKQHTYMVLTKRPERMREWTIRKANAMGWPVEEVWPEYVWLGTSVENQEAADKRIPHLLGTPAQVRWLSCEPLLGPLDLSRYLGASGDNSSEEHLEQWGWSYDRFSGGFIGTPRRGDIPYDPRCGLDWVVVGGESGPRYRPMDLAWARSLRDQSLAAEVPFFYKQSGGLKPETGKELDGRTWEQYPGSEEEPRNPFTPVAKADYLAMYTPEHLERLEQDITMIKARLREHGGFVTLAEGEEE